MKNLLQKLEKLEEVEHQTVSPRLFRVFRLSANDIS